MPRSLTSRLDATIETALPWWANNLVRWILLGLSLPVLMVVMPFFWLASFKTVFSRGSEMIAWPWEQYQ